MTKINEIYKCNVCGNVVEVISTGKGSLVCCREDMQLLLPKTSDAGNEKHVPVIEKTAVGVMVKVGSIMHPMEEQHFIEWIELVADGRVYRKYLHPGEKPEAAFCIQAQTYEAREYCNIHGLWQGEYKSAAAAAV